MNKTKQKKLRVAQGIVTAVFVLVIFSYFSTIIGRADEIRIQKLLDLGNKYLLESDYESAILTFDQIIAIDPKCEEAYLGKAQAQYELGQYEEAIATLDEGIAKVEDSSRLEEFRQQILGEMAWRESGTYSAVKSKSLLLNYMYIIRPADAKEPEIQLEVLGDEGNAEAYSWISSNPECVSVSESGVVTFMSTEGSAYIHAESDSAISDMCRIHINSSDDERDSIRVRLEGTEQNYTINIVRYEEEEEAFITLPEKLIYYSGDVVIPERLRIGSREVAITGISQDAFRWSEDLCSIYIPTSLSYIESNGSWNDNPFFFCRNLTRINVSEENPFMKSVDGVLYSKDGTILYAYPAGKSGSSYTIPKEVETVYNGAFLLCKNLKEILVEEGNPCYESLDGVLIEKQKRCLAAYPAGKAETVYKVPDTVESFSPDVFYGSGLEELVVDEEIESEAWRSKRTNVADPRVTVDE